MGSPPENVKPSTVEPEIQGSQERFGRIAALVMLVISFLALAGVGGLMLFIIPKFEKIFRDFHTALPVATQALVNLSLFVRVYWFVFVPLFFAVYAGLFLLALSRVRYWWIVVLVATITLTTLAVLSVPVIVIALFQPLVGLMQSVNNS